MRRTKDETAPEWLARIGHHDLVQKYQDFRYLLLRNNSGERRSLWDLLAGIRCYDPATQMVTVERFGQRFDFPVFAEVCDYRGVAAKPGAIVTGIRPNAHRKPQVKKWGKKLKNLVDS